MRRGRTARRRPAASAHVSVSWPLPANTTLWDVEGGYGVVSACEFRCRIGLCDTLPQITPVFRALYSVNPSSLRFFDQMLQRCGDLLRNYVEGLQRLLNTARIPLMMIIHAAKPLFAWDCLEDSPSLQTIKDLLAALP